MLKSSPSSLFGSSGFVFSIVGGLTLAGAWLLPETLTCVVLGWVSAFALVLLARQATRPYLGAYFLGIISHLSAFYWIFSTIKDFGGFDVFASSAIFLLFLLLSPLQFPIFVLFFRSLSGRLSQLSFMTAAAWVVAETISIRIFPWHLGHTQLTFQPLSSLASIGGASLVSFVMVWIADLLLRRRWLPTIFLLLTLTAHFIFASSQRATPQARSISTLIVQANIAIEEKHNIKLIVSNRERYLELTQNALRDEKLVIWPETVIQDWIPDSVGTNRNHPALPTLSGEATLISGALTYGSRKNLFNSAIAIFPDGSIPPPYHKRILMPFGEYTPLGDIFPWLQEINSTAGGFTAGDAPSIFELPSGAKIAPLICYEDILPRLGREAANAGAEILVNLTNDAWFGDTVASRQHHLIAAFRAIETGRFLIRSTNTGYTAVVDPSGRTVAALPVYSEGALRVTVTPNSYSTLYMRFGDWPWWILSGLFVVRLIGVFSRRILR